jgi:glutathione synthase/RimK-type ligase-like ATP-grasp enzyme
MILLWGHAADKALKAVYESLVKVGAEIAFYDQREVFDTTVDLLVDKDVRGTLRVRDQTIDLAEVTAAYIRPFDSRWLSKLKHADPSSVEWRHAANVEDVLLSWAEITPAFVVNRPSKMAPNASKPYQAALIKACGFTIPKTLVTTDAQAVREFYAQNTGLIYKSVGSARSVVSRLRPEQLDALDDLTWCPTQFQQYVPGNDYRVHTVGDELFTCEIVCSEDDYRFAIDQEGNVQLRPFELPDEIAERCRQLASFLGLAVAGIDLRLTPNGQWVCFEVNGVPGFTYYQDACNHQIDDAIASLLIHSGGVARTPGPSPGLGAREQQPTSAA